MSTFFNKKSPKIPKKYLCETCDYETSNKKDFDKHCDTQKHKNINFQHFSTDLSQKIPRWECVSCNRTYKERTGLWKHRKICTALCGETIDNKDLVLMLIKENADLKNIMMEVIKNGTNNTTTTNMNSHNKSFNLNMFLNETCKDAMNITDF